MKHLINDSIGIKHDFLCINICWIPREVLKPEPERQWFQHLPRCLADVNVSEKHVWSLLMCKNIFFVWKLWKNCLKKFFLPVPIMTWKSMLPANVLKTPLPGQRLNVISTVHITHDDVSFYEGPGMLICKTAKPCINSTQIALLIQGFVLVKIWLLIAWDTAFYAII